MSFPMLVKGKKGKVTLKLLVSGKPIGLKEDDVHMIKVTEDKLTFGFKRPITLKEGDEFKVVIN